MKTGQPYIRRKGSKYVIEKKIREDGRQRTVYLKTLPPIEKLLEILASKEKGEKAS